MAPVIIDLMDDTEPRRSQMFQQFAETNNQQMLLVPTRIVKFLL